MLFGEVDFSMYSERPKWNFAECSVSSQNTWAAARIVRILALAMIHFDIPCVHQEEQEEYHNSQFRDFRMWEYG
jgi:hypothetical protein